MTEAIDPEGDSPKQGGGQGQGQPQGASEESTKQRKSVLSSIIRTTKATSTRVTPLKAAMAARKCRSCGGARPEGSDLRVCQFCGDRFMTDEAGSGVDPERPPEEG